MNRRAFLGVPLALGCSSGPPESESDPQPNSKRPAPLSVVGAQLYTVRALLSDDFEGTLERIAHIGYRELEFVGYFGKPLLEIRDVVESLGLTAPSAHFDVEALEAGLASQLDAAETLGHRVLCLGWTPPHWRSEDGYARLADLLNQAAESARPRGIRIGYHHHDFELTAPPGEPVPLELLDERLDDDIALQIDTHWAARVQSDPSTLMQRYERRLASCHLKDVTPSGDFAAVGYGDIDWVRVVDTAKALSVPHLFVEHDQPQDPLRVLEDSYRYLTGG